MIDLFSYGFVAQAVGILASALIIYAFTHKSDKRLKIFLMLSNILFASHFFLLGAYAGMAINALNCLRVGLSIKFHNSNKIMLGFISAYLGAGFLVYQNPQDVLPIFSACLGTFAMYKLSGIQMRLCLSVSGMSWLIHDIIYGSIGGVITESVLLVTNVITVFRLYRDKKKQET